MLLVLFEPGLAYHVNAALPDSHAPDFVALLSALVDEPAAEIMGFDVLTNGDQFYASALEAIATAKTSVHLEAFIFHAVPVGERFLRALTERAAAGVKVRVVVDAVGSMLTRDSFFASLRHAGGAVRWYQPLRWYTLKRFNNRTHRELLVIDGQIAFIGGAGIASAWDTGDAGRKPWRDTMVRITGPAVTMLQTVFIENWLEGSGEILAEKAVFPLWVADSATATGNTGTGSRSLVVGSSPTGGRATRARILFQVLVAAARTTICINSPYFLPDAAMRRELLAAAARGVKVKIIVPGKYNNHLMTRYASRRCYGDLLTGGIAIFEYQPGMIHAKIFIVDGFWSVVGSTNFDNRSFGLNDEVNLAVANAAFAARLASDFSLDLEQSTRVTLEEWRRRPATERLLGAVSGVLQRQQ